MPTPVSVTRSIRRDASTAAETVTLPPRSVNLMALATRLSAICLNARGSPVMTGTFSGTRVTRSTPLSRAFKASRLQQWSSAARGPNGSGEISKLPDSIFDMSRMPLTTPSRCSPGSLMRCAYSLRRAAPTISTSSCTIISEKPMMALSGVRNSWLMVARKRVLDASACSATVRASSSACSWSLRSVPSRNTATTSTSGEACSSGRQRISTQMKSAGWLWAPNGTRPRPELDALRLAATRGLRQGGEIGRTVGDVDAVEQAMAAEPGDGGAQHRFGRGRDELHGAVAAVTRDHVAHVSRQQAITVFLDIKQRHAGPRQRLGAKGKTRGIEDRRDYAEPGQRAAHRRAEIRRWQQVIVSEYDQQCRARHCHRKGERNHAARGRKRRFERANDQPDRGEGFNASGAQCNHHDEACQRQRRQHMRALVTAGARQEPRQQDRCDQPGECRNLKRGGRAAYRQNERKPRGGGHDDRHT